MAENSSDIPGRAHHHWTPKEDAYLRTHRAKQTNAQIGAALGRTPKAVAARSVLLRLKTPALTKHPKRSTAAIASFQCTMAARREELHQRHAEAVAGWPKPVRDPEQAWQEQLCGRRYG